MTCPACGGATERVPALRKVGTCGGEDVLRQVPVFACCTCEWIRTVARVEFEQGGHAALEPRRRD